MQIIRGRQGNEARRLMLYGVHGVGKSTFAAQAPDTLFLDIEDGLKDIDCAKTEHLTSLQDVMTALSWLVLGEQTFRWIAMDTLDHLEHLVWDDIAKREGKESIADVPYGAGYKKALAIFQVIQQYFDVLRAKFGTGTIVLAHCEIKRFDNPEADSYDRYRPALHEKASQLWQEWSDEVLFASYRTYVRKEEQGFGKERAVAVGQGERYLRTVETAAVHAKNRLSLPPELPFDWNSYAIYFDPELQAAYRAAQQAEQAKPVAEPAMEPVTEPVTEPVAAPTLEPAAELASA